MGKVQYFLPDGIYERLDKRFHFDTTNAEFLSPRYGEKTGDFVRRAYRRAKKTGEPIVLVIPENMGTKYFQECIEGKAEVIHNDVLDIGCPTMTVIYNGSCTENKGAAYVCALGRVPGKHRLCSPGECAKCGWEAAEDKRRRQERRRELPARL